MERQMRHLGVRSQICFDLSWSGVSECLGLHLNVVSITGFQEQAFVERVVAKAKFSKKIASIDDCMLNKRGEWWEGLATRSMEHQRSKRLASAKLRRRDQESPISTGGPRRSYSTVNRAIEKLKKKNILPTSFVIKQDLVFHCPVDVVVTKNTFLPPRGWWWRAVLRLLPDCLLGASDSYWVSSALHSLQGCLNTQQQWWRNCFQYKITPREEEATNSPAGCGSLEENRCQTGGNMLAWMAKDTSIGGCWATGGHVRF